MKKTELCLKLREYVRENLSPTKSEQNFVSKVYSSFEKITGADHLLQIGSFSRYTAIRPLHDLDILWVLGEWDPNLHNPKEALEALKNKIENEYENPSKHQFKITLQTHSITVSYLSNDDEVFAVDIVPAYSFDKNEFGDDVYMIPELLKQVHEKRQQFYGEHQENKNKMEWIPSDPMGYIEVAKTINQKSSDFRKTVKIVKAWKNSLKDKDETLKLKSFHIEQVITQYFQDNGKEMDIFDAIFKFFCEIPTIIETPRIPDKADKSVMIDQYVADLTKNQKDKIKQARDCFLIKLEELEESSSVAKLVEACFYERNDPSEQYLFDSDFQIPVLINTEKRLAIDGCVKKKDGFREYIYRISTGWGKINANNYIRFEIVNPVSTAEYYLWKVKNDNNCDEPRGEITKNQTQNRLEYTKYPGKHFVECFAVVNKICVARARQDVFIDPKLKY